eukprot:gene3955-5672_t
MNFLSIQPSNNNNINNSNNSNNIKDRSPFPLTNNVNQENELTQNQTSIFQSFTEFEQLRLRPETKRGGMIGKFVSWIIRKVVVSSTQYVTGLEVNVLSPNHDIVRGKVDTIELKFDKVSFFQLFVSGGGRLMLKGVDLRMRRFLFQNLQAVRKPYAVYCDMIFTQLDVVNSKLIKNLFQLLSNTILNQVFSQASTILSVTVKKVYVDSRRISLQGVTKILSDNPNDLSGVPFEVSTSVGVRENGQIVYLKDIQVVLYPDSIITSLPIFINTPIDVYLGENCRIESLIIGNKNIWIRAATMISPVQPFAVTESVKKARYNYDLSATLSKIFMLKGGLAMRIRRWIK